MAVRSRVLIWILLVAALGIAALFPATARAQSGHELARVIVDVADVVLRGGQPYYRHGNYGYNDRLVVVRNRYGRTVYYRQAPRHVGYRPPVRHYYPPTYHKRICNRYGRCTVSGYGWRQHDRYDDRRHDRRGWDNRRRWSGHRGRGWDRGGRDRDDHGDRRRRGNWD